MIDGEASEQRVFERCKRTVLDFCDWVAAEDKRLKVELRALRRRQESERVEARRLMVERAERVER
jgi:hypothetical protein